MVNTELMVLEEDGFLQFLVRRDSMWERMGRTDHRAVDEARNRAHSRISALTGQVYQALAQLRPPLVQIFSPQRHARTQADVWRAEPDGVSVAVDLIEEFAKHGNHTSSAA